MSALADGTLDSRMARRGAAGDTSTLLIWFLTILLVTPSRLAVAPLGGMGTPAILTALGLSLWWAWSRLQGRGGAPRTGIRRSVLVFLAVMCVVYAHAMAQPLPASEYLPADTGFVRLFAMSGLVLTAIDGISSMRSWHRVVDRLVFCCAGLAALGLLQAMTGKYWVDLISIPGLTGLAGGIGDLPRDGFFRPTGTSVHPLEFSAVLAMGLPFAITRLRAEPRSLSRWVGVGLIGWVLIISVSRTAIVAAAIGVAVLVLAWPRLERRVAGVVGLVAVAAIAAIRPGLFMTLVNLFAGAPDDPSVQSRTTAMGVALGFIERQPWLGRGYGTFLPKYWILDNFYLGFTIETGVLGLLTLLAVILTAVVSSRRAARLLADRQDREMVQAVAAALLAVSVMLGFFDVFSFGQSMGVFFVLLGLAGSALVIARSSQEGHASPSSGLSHPPGPQ